MANPRRSFPIQHLAFAISWFIVLATMASQTVDCFVLGGKSQSSRQSLRWFLATNQHNQDETMEEFPFSPDELIAMTKDYFDNLSPDYWAEDFVFRGPVIGPLNKKDLILTLSDNLDLQKAFPDLQTNHFGFCADDPIEPNRVWYFSRPRGTFRGAFQHPVKGLIEPTNAPYIAPPEAGSVVWNADGKIRYQTTGYVTDRCTGDTTGGRGAIFGQYAVMGDNIPFLPGSWLLIGLQKLAEFLPDVPNSYSKDEDLPDWWKDPRKGAEL